MENFTEEKVRKVAKLARISLHDNAIKEYSSQLNEIFKEILKLQKVDTSMVEPITSVTSLSNNYREDIVNDGDCADQILKNAKNSKYNFYVVPKVVE